MWRYAHLALAIIASVFLIVASATGAILAIDAINEKLPPHKAENFDEIRLSETLSALKKTYPELVELTVDANQFVILQGFDNSGNEVNGIVNPLTGEILGEPRKKSEFIQWVTSLHRSLFLHDTGRILVGISAFLLLMIATSGLALLVSQRGWKVFFKPIRNDNFFPFAHASISRFLLVPIILISGTGAHLTLDRFEVFAAQKTAHQAVNPIPTKIRPWESFDIFKSTLLKDVRKIEFPFTDEPDEYFTVALSDREILIHQQSGEVLGTKREPASKIWQALSFELHTGSIGMVWAGILALCSIGILFFIYSGFAITLKRQRGSSKGAKAQEAQIVILAGSQTGATHHFAHAIFQQLAGAGHRVYLGSPDDYQTFYKATHLILLTSTYGLGDAPINAGKFLKQLEKHAQNQSLAVSVVGFGSQSYPDFCGFAKKAYKALIQQSWAQMVLPLHTVNEQSVTEFTQWAAAWSQKTGMMLDTAPAVYRGRRIRTTRFTVVEKIEDDRSFCLVIKPAGTENFTSGDLLAIYPQPQIRRLYSIGKIGRNIQLIVRNHPGGIGSGFLHRLEPGDVFEAKILPNPDFHLRENLPTVMVANGTGIAPFLGMATQGRGSRIYGGFRTAGLLTDFYQKFVSQYDAGLKLAFSREGSRLHVTDLVWRDAVFFAAHLKNGGVVMICGSLTMQRDVEDALNAISLKYNKVSLDNYRAAGQILTDCY